MTQATTGPSDPGATAPRTARGKKDCHERALGLLAVRARSRRELERRLLAAGFEQSEVDDSLARLERVGLVDDVAFSRQLAEHAFGNRGDGRRAVASALAAKGIDPSVATAVLDELAGDEQERADRLAASRVGRLRSLPPEKAFQRLSGLLLRRGYLPEIARSASRRALGVASSDD